MKCKRCEAVLKEEDLFCLKCGQKKDEPLVCSGCGNVLFDGSKFCSFCGEKSFEFKRIEIEESTNKYKDNESKDDVPSREQRSYNSEKKTNYTVPVLVASISIIFALMVIFVAPKLFFSQSAELKNKKSFSELNKDIYETLNIHSPKTYSGIRMHDGGFGCIPSFMNQIGLNEYGLYYDAYPVFSMSVDFSNAQIDIQQDSSEKLIVSLVINKPNLLSFELDLNEDTVYLFTIINSREWDTDHLVSLRDSAIQLEKKNNILRQLRNSVYNADSIEYYNNESNIIGNYNIYGKEYGEDGFYEQDAFLSELYKNIQNVCNEDGYAVDRIRVSFKNNNINNTANQQTEKRISDSSSNSVLYKIKVNVNNIRIRTSPGIRDDNKYGSYAELNHIYDVYEATSKDGYTWYRIGNGMWIADNGQWITILDSNSESSIDRESVLYQIRIKSEIRIRPSASTSGSIIGHVYEGDICNAYEMITANDYTWYRIGQNQWIADDGTWTERINDNNIIQQDSILDNNDSISNYENNQINSYYSPDNEYNSFAMQEQTRSSSLSDSEFDSTAEQNQDEYINIRYVITNSRYEKYLVNPNPVKLKRSDLPYAIQDLERSNEMYSKYVFPNNTWYFFPTTEGIFNKSDLIVTEITEDMLNSESYNSRGEIVLETDIDHIQTYNIIYNISPSWIKNNSDVYTPISGYTFSDPDESYYKGQKEFLGWYDSNGNRITKIAAGTEGDVYVTARYRDINNNTATNNGNQSGGNSSGSHSGGTSNSSSNTPSTSQTYSGSSSGKCGGGRSYSMTWTMSGNTVKGTITISNPYNVDSSTVVVVCNDRSQTVDCGKYNSNKIATGSFSFTNVSNSKKPNVYVASQ